jgi:hypothetical protein
MTTSERYAMRGADRLTPRHGNSTWWTDRTTTRRRYRTPLIRCLAARRRNRRVGSACMKPSRRNALGARIKIEWAAQAGRALPALLVPRVQTQPPQCGKVERMRSDQGKKAQSMFDSQHFVKVNPELGALAAAPATKQLDQAVALFQQNVVDQANAVLQAPVHKQRAKDLAFRIARDYLTPIRQFARRNLKGTPEYAALTVEFRAQAGRRLATEARAMATAATPLVDRFTAAGFSPTFIPELGALADQLDRERTMTVETKARRIAATQGIEQAVNSGREAIRMLDPVVTTLLKGDKLLASWHSVKRVKAPPAPALTVPIGPTTTPSPVVGSGVATTANAATTAAKPAVTVPVVSAVPAVTAAPALPALPPATPVPPAVAAPPTPVVAPQVKS